MAKGVINLQKESGGVTKITSTDGTGITELVLPESGAIVSVDTAVTDNAIARYDGTTGKLQDSGVTIDDNGVINCVTSDGGVSLSMKGRASDSTSGVYFLSNDGAKELGFVGKVLSGGLNKLTIDSSGTNAQIEFRLNNSIKVILDSSSNFLLTSGTGALGYGTGSGGTVTQLTSKSTAVTLNKPTGRIIMNNAALAANTLVSFTFNNSLLTINDILLLKLGVAGSNYSIDANISTNGSAGVNLINRYTSSRSDALEITFEILKGAVA